jgi:hypothetical protein
VQTHPKAITGWTVVHVSSAERLAFGGKLRAARNIKALATLLTLLSGLPSASIHITMSQNHRKTRRSYAA